MILDVNAAVGRWPFCEIQSVTAARLSSLLKRAGVDRALVSSLEAVFHEDPNEDNRRLFRQLRGNRRLLAVPVINARLADWADRLAEWTPTALAVKILPSYHAFSLADANVAGLAAGLAKAGRPLLVQIRMEDERTQSPAFRVPAVPMADVAALAERFPRLTIVALCAYTPEATDLLEHSPGVRMDVSMLDGLDVVGNLVKKHRPAARRLLLGSHSPLQYTQAAALKVQTAQVPEHVRKAILGQSARQILGL
jgi:predicted TIM-barrel fold metal-dependent hydrolase